MRSQIFLIGALTTLPLALSLVPKSTSDSLRLNHQIPRINLGDLVDEIDELLNDLLGNKGYGVDVTVKDMIDKNGGSVLGCAIACDILSLALPSAVSFPTSPSYKPLVYWSVQQTEVVPACRVDATSAFDISSVIRTSTLTQCPFAVRSGGHTSFAGGSSIAGGILINLARLNQVSLSASRTVSHIGPGNVWSDVYSVLDPMGVSVVGGREAGVGVGGLLLGGGISYFSGRYGWGCDNVLGYEVILASGDIVYASSSQYSDLYHALRGGSGTNFGIVSRFDLMAFEQGQMWGGSNLYSMAQNISLADMFAKFVVDAPTDNYAHLYIAFVYAAQLGGFLGVTGPTYGKPIADAPIFEEMRSIPVLVNETSIATMGQLATALNQTDFLRETFRTVTFKNNANLLKQIIAIFVEEASPLLTIPGFFPSIAFQPISLNIISQMQKRGGNVLGLTGADGPLTIMNLNWSWSNTQDDNIVLSTLARFVNRSVVLAKSMNLDNEFIYMNYASHDQNVFAGYGQDNVNFLKAVQRKYDPTGVFARLQLGYFKL